MAEVQQSATTAKNPYAPNPYRSKFKSIISEMRRKNEDPDFIRYVMDQEGYDMDMVNEELANLDTYGTGQPVRQKDVDPNAVPGAGLDQNQLAEGQRSTLLYGQRMYVSGKILDSLDESIAEKGFFGAVGQKIDEMQVGGTITGQFVGEEFKKFDQAKRDFINASLRRESGAVISPQEFDNADKQYFPVPGDSAEVLAQKKANRELQARGFLKSAGVDDAEINFDAKGTINKPKPRFADPLAAQAWLDANPTDPRAEQVRKLLEEQNRPLGDNAALESGAAEKPGVLDAIGETGTALMGRVKNIFAEASDRPDSVRDVVANVFGEKQLRMLGQVAGGVGDLFVGAAKVAYRSLDEDKRQSIEDGTKEILSTEAGQAGLKALGQGMEAYQSWKEANPETAKDIEAIANIASVFPVGKVTGVAGKEVKNIVGDVARMKGGFTKTDDILKAQVEAGMRPDMDVATLSKGAKSQIDEAVKQGFEERDVKFLATMAPEDRSIAGQMLSLADEANASPRVLRRPIDLAGETLTSKVKIVTDKVAEYGKQVDIEAKNLRGITINSAELGASARQALEAIGVKVKGKTLDFKGSVFKMTPQLQATVKKFFQEIPGDTTDAYQLHIFKKAIDEIVTYGSQGEGLKGSAERLLKGLRKSADDILDNSFDGYKVANEQFREAKQIADSALDLFGKKNGVQSSVRGGQVLRGAFSNNQTRSKVYELAEMLDNYEKKLFGKTSGNALDQAMFAEILEKSSLFKTQAITGFAGGIESAVGKAIDAVDIVRNPIRGGLNATANMIEKARNLTPEGKRKALENLLKGVLTEKKPIEFKSRLFNFKPKAGMSVEDVKLGKAGYSDDLLQEARKYKSAEEFVKAQTKFIHETDAPNIDKFDMSKIGSGQGDAWLGRGVYSQEKGTFKIEQYGKNKVDVGLTPNAKIFKIEETPNGKWRDNFVEWYAKNHPELEEQILKEFRENPPMRNAEEILKGRYKNVLPRDLLMNRGETDFGTLTPVGELRKNGYDGLIQDGELVVYNSDVLKTKSQLTDLWKKANVKTKNKAQLEALRKLKGKR